MKGRGEGRAARKNEGIERRQIGVHRVDLVLEPLDLRGDNTQRLSAALATLGRAQIGAEIEEVVLNTRKHVEGLTLGVEPGQTDRGIGLVDRAESLDAQRLLFHPRAIAERSLALVAALRVDAREADHQWR